MRSMIMIFLLAAMLGSIAGCSEGKANDTSASAAGAPADPPAQQDTPKAATACDDCGTIVAIKPVKVAGDNSGMGAVIGAAVGGVLGHQMGGGRGKDATTAAGVIGGALAGNAIEKHRNTTTSYAVTVKLDNGQQQTVTVASADKIAVGTQVEVVGNNLRIRQSSS